MTAGVRWRSAIWRAAAAFALVALAVGWRIGREILPVGVPLRDAIPFLLFSSEGLVVADGRVLAVRTNDGGIMHSAPYWVWVIERSSLWGKRVVGEGEVGDAVTASVVREGGCTVIAFVNDAGRSELRIALD